MHGPLIVTVKCYRCSVLGCDTIVWFMVTNIAERPASPHLDMKTDASGYSEALLFI